MQDEAYNHIEQAEMDKVKEQVTAKRTWHDSQLQACHALTKTANPPVTAAQIKAELKVTKNNYYWYNVA